MLLPKYKREEAANKMRQHAMVIGLIAVVVVAGSLAYGSMLVTVFNYMVRLVLDML